MLPILDSTCIKDIAVDRADIIRSTSTQSILVSTVCIFHEGVRACLRLDDVKCPDWSLVKQDVRNGCFYVPLLFNVLFAGVILAAYAPFEVGKTAMDVPVDHI